MKTLLLAPHNDDETLFAFYQCLRHQPHVVVVLRSYKQAAFEDGPTYDRREAETRCAMALAGCTVEQWENSDLSPDWRAINWQVETLLSTEKPDLVIAPAWEFGGHEHHNAVANIVSRLRPVGVTRYLTYKRGQGRSMNGTEIVGDERESSLKMTALECYQSQAELPSTAPWFNPFHYGDLREWLA